MDSKELSQNAPLYLGLIALFYFVLLPTFALVLGQTSTQVGRYLCLSFMETLVVFWMTAIGLALVRIARGVDRAY
ncbi:MAG: hypothetical protein KAV87_19475 [Desulfobacteraceae bacterium]|nr:hypothetical protein [Desulfobacteraceae bacterium]